MITTILIDIDGTLLDFNAAVEKSIKISSRIHGVTMPENITDIFHPINNELWHKIERSEIDLKTLRKIRWNLIFSKAGVEYDGEKFESTFYELISESAVPVEGAIGILEYLSEKYTLCAASNAVTNQQIKRLKKCNMYDYFHHIFTSEMFGASKPSPAFFDGCFQKLGNPSKKEVVIIGDSIKADIIGGKDYGLTTVFFDPTIKYASPHESVDFTIHNLSMIKNIL